MDYKQTQRNNNLYKIKLIKKPTKAELIFKKFLEDKGIRFMFQKGFLKPFHRIVDFYIPKKKLSLRLMVNITMI